MLPAGPTVVDIMANGALYFGALHVLAQQERPVWSQMSFSTAEENFTSASMRGLDAGIYWPGSGEVPVTELVLRRLLPLAHEGLRAWGVVGRDPGAAARASSRVAARPGATARPGRWRRYTRFEASGLDRWEALRRMTQEYVLRMHTQRPRPHLVPRLAPLPLPRPSPRPFS